MGHNPSFLGNGSWVANGCQPGGQPVEVGAWKRFQALVVGQTNSGTLTKTGRTWMFIPLNEALQGILGFDSSPFNPVHIIYSVERILPGN